MVESCAENYKGIILIATNSFTFITKNLYIVLIECGCKNTR